MGSPVRRSARPHRRPAMDRADPLQRDQGLCSAGHREQRRLRPHEPELAGGFGACLQLSGEEPPGLGLGHEPEAAAVHHRRRFREIAWRI